MVSHDLEEVFKICHRIVVFYKGLCVFESPIENTDRGEVLYYLMGGEGNGHHIGEGHADGEDATDRAIVEEVC